MLNIDSPHINDQVNNCKITFEWNTFRDHCIENSSDRFKDDFYKRVEHLIGSCTYIKRIQKGNIFFRARNIGPEKIRIDKNHVAHGYTTIEEAGAPPTKKCKSGRANMPQEKVLYLAQEEYTAVAEIKPIVTQLINISQFKINSDISVLNLPASNDEFQSFENREDSLLIKKLIWEFAKPINDPKEYLPTQCISNLIKDFKNIKYDGIMYASMCGYGGQNLVLFDPNKADFVANKEEIVRINNLFYTIVNINKLTDKFQPEKSPIPFTQSELERLKVVISSYK
ncbi:MAG: RES family NAD+ phosphorylase [Oscillospiraceae bacterium]|jgi:hypothetical protein|nr:RES family NAD+ phosphorylase [Oscillospiraceae bacterium]MCI2190731.1 RES family NAD+ phosphorylase [Oscillospiraceae bacterium]